MRALAIILIATFGALACSSPSPAAADRSACAAVTANGGKIAVIDDNGMGPVSPALDRLITAFNAAVAADIKAENTPGDIGGTTQAAIRGLNAYGALTDWCSAHGYKLETLPLEWLTPGKFPGDFCCSFR